MPPTTRAAAAAAASTHNLPGEALVPSPTPPPPLPTLPSEGKEQPSATTQTTGAAASMPPAQQTRQTRRNTQTVSNDQGTHVMDPWKDDRLRDFVAINVLTRIRSFHLPDDAPLAGAGSINKQRVDQLYLLPRTKARCSGDATDCPLRRVFCRIFGPAALHHEQHSASSTVVLFDEGVKATPLFSAATPLQMKSATDREDALVASPDPAVHLLAEDPASSASEVVAAVIKREDGEDDEEQAAQVAARRSLFGDDDHDAAIDSTVVIKSESVDVLTESITTVVSADETQQLQQLSPTFGPTPPSVVPVLPATASSSSLPSAAVPHSNLRGQSVATTAGSATPADYRSDLDCHCCTDCVDAMCAHYQSLLTRGVIFDRFSQKDFLFAHWVLFQNMEGAAMDSHGALSRKEALSIQVKSGYYDLLKVPRSEDEVLQQVLHQQQQSSSSPPMSASVTPGAALLPAAPSSSSDQAVVAEGGTNSGSVTTSTIAPPPPRKRNRSGTTHHSDEPLLSAKVKLEDEEEGAPAATPASSGSYLKDAGSARRPSRRTEATQPIDAATAAAPSASSATVAASEMPPPPRKGRANQYTKARDLALAAAAAAAAAAHPIAVKKEEPSSPTATSRTSTPSHSSSSNNNTRAGSTATSDSGDAKNQWSVPPVLSLGGGGSSSSSLSTQLLSLSMMTSTAKLSKHARIRMRDEEAAIMVLLGCDTSTVSSAVATTPTTTPTSPHADEKDFASATVGSGSGLAQYHQLVAENRHPVQSTRESVTSARILDESEELRRQKIQAATPQKPTTGIQITRTSRRGQTSELSSSSAGSHDDRDDASLVTTAATNAMAEEPLRHYTFEQQCLLLLAASRWIDPDVAVGPLFLPSVTEETEESSSTARPIRNTVNYWSAKAVAATLDPPSRGVHLTPYAHDM